MSCNDNVSSEQQKKEKKQEVKQNVTPLPVMMMMTMIGRISDRETNTFTV